MCTEQEQMCIEVKMKNQQAIVDYIQYLKEQEHLSVSVHFHVAPFFDVLSVLKIAEIHENPYCTFIRNMQEVHWKCLECQRKAAAKCRKVGAFSGVCHAGVFEYVYPILLKGKPEGLLCVSGYAAPDSKKVMERFANKNELDLQTVQTFYDALDKEIPPQSKVDTLIYPLLHMIELLSYKEKLKKEPSRKLSDKILEYCRQNYLMKITAEDLSKRFFCSRSYLAHLFKKETGRTLPGYINYYRLQTAMQILKNSKVSLEEIATLCGFEDRSHFSKCFKKEFGMSPREWRKKTV